MLLRSRKMLGSVDSQLPPIEEVLADIRRQHLPRDRRAWTVYEDVWLLTCFSKFGSRPVWIANDRGNVTRRSAGSVKARIIKLRKQGVQLHVLASAVENTSDTDLMERFAGLADILGYTVYDRMTESYIV